MASDIQTTALAPILAVDDRPENLILIEAMLAPLRVGLVTTTDPNTALDYVKEQKFSILLLDVELPGFSGIELARKILELPNIQSTPIIFISAKENKDKDFISSAYEVGAIDYVTKPIDPNTLRGKISNLLAIGAAKQALEYEVEQRKLAENQLKRASNKLDALLHAIGEGVVELDGQGLVVFANPMAASLLCWGQHQLIGVNFFETVSGGENYAYKNILSECESGNVYRERNGFFKKRNGGILPVEFVCTLVDGQDGRESGLAVIIHDITERKLHEKKLTHLAEHDALTGLGNRSRFCKVLPDMLHDAHAGGFKVAVLFIDLDRFKSINDSCGHDVGDLILCEVANRLKSVLRQEDIIARFGGDEFTVLLSGFLTRDALIQVCKKINRSIVKPFLVGGNEIMITTSIGVAIYPDITPSAEKLIKFADMAMYLAKDAGRNQYCFFTEETNKRMARKLSLEYELRNAISNNEFRVVYQPIYDISNHSIVAFEALLRWTNKELGVVPSNDFIGVAEEMGLINNIGQWVIDEVLKQLKAWELKGLVIKPVSVNVSAEQLKTDKIVTFVRSKLHENQLPAHYLQIELTENALMKEREIATHILSQLHAMGCCIAIDDFGTGYSSLAYLKDLPIDVLKIDRSFVTECQSHQESLTIVKSVIELAKNLNLLCIAEGVEQAEELETLKELRCEFAQGYYFAVPLEVDQAETYLCDRPDNVVSFAMRTKRVS